MNKTIVLKALKAAGFTGTVHVRKHDQFGTPDDHGPAIHRRILDLSHDVSDIMHSVERDGFETVVIYIEPKSYYKYRALIQNPKHVWLEGEVSGLRKQLGYCGGWSKAAREEFTEDLNRMNFPEFKITKEQSKFGIEWLKRSQFKLNGEIRAGAFIGTREAKIIRNFKEFRFVGLEFSNFNQYTGTYQVIAPIYKTIAKNGDSFSYTCKPIGGFGASYEVVGG